MARARFIRPEFFTDEKLGELPFGARLLFAGIWCHADLRGVFEHSAKQLRVRVFPFDEGLTGIQVDAWLTTMADVALVSRFEAAGKVWGKIKNWERYQSISPREVEIWTKWPAPPGWFEPAAWNGYISAALKAGRIRNDPRTVPEQFRNFSPSISPATTPTPPPSPSEGANDSDDSPAAAAAAGSSSGENPLAKRIAMGVDVAALRIAIVMGDPIGIAGAFRANTAKDRHPDWLRDTHGLQAGVIAGILAIWHVRNAAIREPSGFRRARDEFKTWSVPSRIGSISEVFGELGIGDLIPPKDGAA